jgi:hypothetical protein
MCNSVALVYIAHRDFEIAPHCRHFTRRIYVFDLRHCGESSDLDIRYLYWVIERKEKKLF